jgi:hypothetical protein
MGLKINPDPHLQNNLMAFGFDCDRGWYKIINELIEKLQNLDDYNGELFQVKEKYGGLRFYVSNENDKVSNLISCYETYSEHICEYCGEFYTAKNRSFNGWYKTLCNKCAKKYVKGTLYQNKIENFFTGFLWKIKLKKIKKDFNIV